ncbi:MAG TPA: hypothetical protein VHJ78_00525 [Actinomycetota bacterium]|nr:hypothetical protein [Actinomycetota bacterium]
MPFFEWVRKNSEHYLLEASQRDMARKYLGVEPPVSGASLEAIFFRRLFVPIYRRIPWFIRRAILLAMPGSHRQEWAGRSPPAKPN